MAIVPQTVINSGSGGESTNALEGIMSLVLAKLATAQTNGDKDTKLL